MKLSHRIGSAAIAATMLFSMIPLIATGEPVRAAGYLKNESNSCLGTSALCNPVKPTSTSQYWRGNYVYYGNWDEMPLKFRVLDVDSSDYSGSTGKTILLDCDNILYFDKYGQSKKCEDGKTHPYFDWAKNDCVMKNNLATKMSGEFMSDIEWNSLYSTTKAQHEYGDYGSEVKRTPEATSKKLTNEKVFLLDFEDVYNPDYGYYHGDKAKSRIKYDDSMNACPYYLRSSYRDSYYYSPGPLQASITKYYYWASLIDKSGDLSYYDGDNGISPAMNVDCDNIVFATAVEGAKGGANTAYKLTLLDENMFVSVPSDQEITLKGTTLTVPYSISGSNAQKCNQVTVLVQKETGSDAEMVFYSALKDTTTNVGSVTIPQDVLDLMENDGRHYKMYIIPECANGKYETDYAGHMTRIQPPTFDLAAVKGCQVSVTDSNSVKLSWNTLQNATGYEVWVRYNTDNRLYDWELLSTTNSTEAVFNDPIGTSKGGSVVNAVYYKVCGTAERSGVKYSGPFSDTVTPLIVLYPDAVIDDNRTKVTLTWGDIGADGYVIYRKYTTGHSRSEMEPVQVAMTKDTTAIYICEDSTRPFVLYIRPFKMLDGEYCYGDFGDAISPKRVQRELKYDLTSGSCTVNDIDIEVLYKLGDLGFCKIRKETDERGITVVKFDFGSDGTQDLILHGNTLSVLDTCSMGSEVSYDLSGWDDRVSDKVEIIISTSYNTRPSPKVTATPVPTSKPTAKPTATTKPAPTGTVNVTPTPVVTSVPSDPKAQILAFVDRIYVYVLDREPEEEGAAFWSEELWSFKRTGAEVAQGFIFSPEFENRKTTDEQFVTILYKTFFGREPDEGGMKYWLEQLKTGTMDRPTVANGFIYSQEWADTCAEYGIRSGGDIKPTGKIKPTELTYKFVERMYTTAMGRGYDEEGRQYWASELANFNITGEQVGAAFFLSDEMTNYKLDDKEYLNRLYKTFMDREPDSDGAAYWLGVLASGTTRSDVVFGFTRSPEFTEKCVEARILPY